MDLRPSFTVAFGQLLLPRTPVPVRFTGLGVVLLFLVYAATPSFAAESISVAQLEQTLASAHEKRDSEVAKRLLELDLTERLSATRLAAVVAQLPGPQSRMALMALADLSVFLDPPSAEVPRMAAPDRTAQRKMVALAVDYVTKTIHQLPNFSATRVTNSFAGNPWSQEEAIGHHSGETVAGLSIHGGPLRHADTSSASVVYRGGEEVLQTGATRSGSEAMADLRRSGLRGFAPATDSGSKGLVTSGEFGPILNTMLLDAAQGNLAWKHWEMGSGERPSAVFHFEVAPEKSHYDVSYCCILKQNGDRVYFHQFLGYYGEITIDPSDGTILRLSIKAVGLKQTDPIVKANIVVDYGLIELGGKTYICPVKGVALSVTSQVQPTFGGMHAEEDNRPPLRTSLNDIAFERYHLYGASVRILPGSSNAP